MTHPTSKEESYRNALAAIRQQTRSDPVDIETAVGDLRSIYDIANMALFAGGAGFTLPDEAPQRFTITVSFDENAVDGRHILRAIEAIAGVRVERMLPADPSAFETPKPSNQYLSDNVGRLSKFYDAVKTKLTMAEQNELWSIVGNLGNLSVGRWATDACSNQSAGLSKYARDWLVNLRRESGGYPAEVLRHINILEIDVKRAERIADHVGEERDRLHRQLLQHAEVCGESAYPLGERSSAVETKARLTDAQCDEVIDQLQEIEWSGITRDDVRTWDGMIAEARCSSPVETKPKPTIEGLERLLQAEDSKQVYVWPDGYVHDTPPPEKAPEAHIDYNVPGCDCLGCELAPKASAHPVAVCGKLDQRGLHCQNPPGHEGDCDGMPF